MDFDLDLFADTIPQHTSCNARAGSKFQPKSKARSKKETPSTLNTGLSSSTKENSVITTSSHHVVTAVKPLTPDTNLQDSVQSLSPADPGQSGLIDSIHVSSFSVNNSIIRQCVMTVEDPSSKLIGAELLANKTETSHSGVHLSDGDKGSETVGSLSQDIMTKEDAGSTNAIFSESAIFNGNMDIHSGFGKLGGEAGDIFFELESLDNIVSKANTSTGGTENNFQCNAEVSSLPVTKLLTSHPIASNAVDSNVPLRDHILHSSNHQESEEENCIQVITSVNFPDATESISCPGDAELTPQIYLDESSVPTFRPDGFLDFSTMRFSESETTPSDHPPELLVTEGPTNLVEASHLDVLTSEKVTDLQAPGGTSKRGTRKNKQSKVLGSQNFEQPSQRGWDQRAASTAGEENEASKSSRRLRKRIAVNVPADEREDGIGESENVHRETSNCSDIEEDDDEYKGKDTSRKRRAPRKPKKCAPENDGPVQRHKKASEGQDPSEKKPQKKRFSHSTKRKRRLVDKVLLEMPEDEINPQKLMIRDLILLAEAKERLMNKAVISKKSSPNKSANSSIPHDASYNEDGSFASMQGLNSDDDQGSQQVQRSSSKLNYHSFMDRTPCERWSKQDTELFYEAIRQFGTDFAMIQQLFPGRTRHQVKLKYKKEERQHPLRLSDALTNRSKDHSHFELVIQRLQAAAEAEKNSDGDVASVAMTDEEEMAREENEVAKSEQKVEEQVANDLETEVPEVHTTPKSPHSEDDFCSWSQYRGADYSYPEDEEKGEYDL